MGSYFRALLVAIVGGLLASSAAMAGGALIGEPGVALALSCENGHTYPVRPRAVAIDGDLVTGYLVTVHGQGIHVRLVPMGFGYRYAGPGVWFDGIRGDALLYFSKYHPIACHVVAS